MNPNDYDPGGMRRFRIDAATDGWKTQKVVTHPSDGSAPEVTTESVWYGEFVAQACIFSGGRVVVSIIGCCPVVRVFDSFGAFRAQYPDVGGKFRYRWEDKCCFQCGVTADYNDGPGTCATCGCSWDSPVDYPNPSQGKWVHAGTVNP